MKLIEKIVEYENYLVFLLIPLFWIVLLLSFHHDVGYWVQYWWMFPIALIIATTVNTVGISGAALFVPFFVLIFPLVAAPLAPEQSVKLGLITESFGLSSSALAFIRYGLTDKKLGLSIVIKAIPFVIGGSILSFYLPDYMIYFLIATILAVSVYLILHKERTKSKLECIDNSVVGKHRKKHDDNTTLVTRDGKKYKYCRNCGQKKRVLGYGVGGIFQGMAGFGIGELGIVSMVLSKIPLRIAIGTNHIIVALTATIASLTHVALSFSNEITTPWNIVFMTVPAVIIGGQIAPYVAAKLKTSILEYFVSGLFILLVISLLFLGVNSLGV